MSLISKESSPSLEVRKEDFSLSPSLRKSGLVSPQKEFKTPIKDENGNLLLGAPAHFARELLLPASRVNLLSWSKGSLKDSLTWFANFWLKIIKVAQHFNFAVQEGR